MVRLDWEVHIEDSIAHLNNLERTFQTIYFDPPFDLGRTFKYSAVLDGPEFQDSWDGDDYAQWLDALVGACKRVLAPNGTLFLHMSAGQSLVPEKVLNKHFKRVDKIFWQKAHGKNTVKNKLGAVVDIIFMAGGGKRKFNLIHTPLDAYYLENSYTQEDEHGLYALGAIKHDKTRTSSHMYDVADPETGRVYRAKEVAPYGWRMPEEDMLEMIQQGRIHFSKQAGATLYKKLYKDEVKGVPLSDLWTDVHYITRTDQDKRYYPTQKPFKLLRRIVALSSDPGDWVLDPCAGSGTTGAAALSLGRHAYMIDVNPEAEPIITERLEKAQEGGIVPIEDDTNPEEASKKTKKTKKKGKKAAKPKPDPGQTTLTQTKNWD
jgi:DNA modification methylase